MEPKKQTPLEAFEQATKPLTEILDAIYTLRMQVPKEAILALAKELQAEKELKPGETAAETQFPAFAEQKKQLAKLLDTPASEFKAMQKKVVDAAQQLAATIGNRNNNRGPKNN